MLIIIETAKIVKYNVPKENGGNIEVFELILPKYYFSTRYSKFWVVSFF